VYTAFFCDRLVDIMAFVASATEMERQLVCSYFIVNLLRTNHSACQGKTVWYVLATVARVATCWEQTLMNVCWF